MNAHVSQNDLTYVVPSALSQSSSAPYPMRRQRNPLLALMAEFGHWLGELPRRRAVLNELSAMSDHELADIGLSRGDLPRVFDPAFAKARQAR